MAHYVGTHGNDYVRGANESNTFDDFGIGQDVLIGGLKNDVFNLSVDATTDFVDGGYGIDTIDYSGADRAVRIDLYHGVVTATFGSGSFSSYDPAHVVTVAQVQNVENATGSSFDDTIIGTDTDNTGTNGANVLNGGAGNDYLYGLGGNDTLIGGPGNDYIDGGSGSDTVSYADVDRGFGVFLNLTDHSLNGLTANQGLFQNSTGVHVETDTVVGVENAIGTPYTDVLVSGSGPNVLDGGAGDDFLFGGSGGDTLIGGDGDDNLWGGDGADHLIGGNGSDWARYSGTSFDPDSTQPYSGTVVISLANPASDTWFAAGDSYDSIENIEGSSFNDVITGDDNDNIIVDRAGSNVFNGNGGRDTFIGSRDHPDTFNGGNDEDTVDYSQQGSSSLPVTIDFEHPSANAGGALGDVFTFVEDIIGSPQGDTIYGDYANNTFRGRGGDDRLMGRGGDDTLIGGEGTDTAVFTGNFADYTFRTLHFNDGQTFLEVHDTRADRDGTDYVIEIERLEFHNITVNTWDLLHL